MLRLFIVASKILWRDIRAGEWRVVLFALILSITAITALEFYTSRLQQGLEQQSAQMLGGDLVISSATPITSQWISKAHSLNIKSAQVWTFPTIISFNQKLQLVNLQAVSANYPVFSQTPQVPDKNTVWIAQRLMPLLGLHIGGSVNIGSAAFTVKQALPANFDALDTGLTIAPRVLMRLDDVAATRTVIPGSRVTYLLLLAGDKNSLSQYRQWLTPQLQASQRISDIYSQRLVLRQTLHRAEVYLQLAVLVSLIMSSVAIILSIKQFLRRHYATVALWRTFGAPKRQVIFLLLQQLIIIAFISGLIGGALGYVIQLIFAHIFNQYFNFIIPPPLLYPLIIGLITAFLFLFAGAIPIITELPKVSLLMLWREESDFLAIKNHNYILSIILMIGFLYCLSGFTLLTLFFLDAVIFSVAILYVLNHFILRFMGMISLYSRGAVYRGINNLVHYADSVSIQVISLTLIFTVILVLNLLRTNLLQQWHSELPKNTPNYFAFNIAPGDISGIKKLFAQNNINIAGVYPMIRGRMVKLNNQAILSAIPASARGTNALHRELNLSWMIDLPSDNKVVSGSAISVNNTGQRVISVEKNLAEDLHLRLGDALTFQIGDQQLTAKIINFRTLSWATFHPNFYIIFPPGVLENYPSTYITSFYLLPGQTDLLNQLVQDFPNITIIDVASVLQQIQSLVSKITLAMELLLIFALGIASLVVYAAVQATIDERRYSYRILSILGANKKYLQTSIVTECVLLGMIIVVLSFSLASVITHLLLNFISA